MRKVLVAAVVLTVLVAGHPADARRRHKPKPPPETVTQCGRHTDFNGDGFDDLAVGAPFESPDYDDLQHAGAVNVIYGTASGLSGNNAQFWHQDSPGILGVDEGSDQGDPDPRGDEFGTAVTTGDFNGDGFSDLAVAVPEEFVEDQKGAVNVIYGSASGLTSAGNQLWTEGVPHMRRGDDTDFGTLFASSVFACDFDGDKISDLAIGAPAEVIEGEVRGAVHVLYGTRHGLDVDGDQLFSEGFEGVTGTPVAGEGFGLTLGGGDIDGDRFADLVVGSPVKPNGAAENVGSATVILGSTDGLKAAGSKSLTLDGVAGQTPQEDDYFGYSFAVGDIDHDGHNELAVSAPARTVNGQPSAGALVIFPTTSAGPTATGATYYVQGSPPFDGTPGESKNFGLPLASGDFEKDGLEDLVVGTAGETVSGLEGAGIAYIVHGSTSGLGTTVIASQDATIGAPIIDHAEQFDSFGAALSVADFNGDGKSDLAVGVPFEDLEGTSTVSSAGLVNILYAGSGEGNDDFTQDQLHPPLSDTSEESDRFGFALG